VQDQIAVEEVRPFIQRTSMGRPGPSSARSPLTRSTSPTRSTSSSPIALTQLQKPIFARR
jgi:hypothetical protein